MSRTVRPQLRSPPDRRDPEDLRRLRLVKRLVALERRRPPDPVPRATGEGIQIIVHERGPYVRFPASPDDLRAVLARLPPDTGAGIARIELLLDENPAERSGGKVDPFVGRLTCTLAAGLYGGPVLGLYQPGQGRILLHAYVYDPARADRVVVDLCLRLQTLATFVHELAHHDDFAARGGRRQWRRGDSEIREAYAQALEHVWTHDHVVPYLREKYSDEAAELARWLMVHGGSTLPLEALAIRGVGDAFEYLVHGVAKGKRPPATRVEFAAGLHRAGEIDEALAVLARVLDEDPRDEDALLRRGWILIDLGRMAEANEIARSLLAKVEAGSESLDFACSVARGHGDWHGVLDLSERIGRCEDRLAWQRWDIDETRTRALLVLGELTCAGEVIGRLAERTVSERQRRTVEVLRCLLHLARGEYPETLASATALLRDGARQPDALAAPLEAAHRSGRPEEAEALDAPAIERLRAMGYAAWVAGLPATEKL